MTMPKKYQSSDGLRDPVKGIDGATGETYWLDWGYCWECGKENSTIFQPCLDCWEKGLKEFVKNREALK